MTSSKPGLARQATRAGEIRKSSGAFLTISEVSETLGVAKHVLRFWEQKFPAIKPMKRGGGRRFYRPEDVELLRGIRHLLQSEAVTIKGVQKILREQGLEAVKRLASAAPATRKAATRAMLAPFTAASASTTTSRDTAGPAGATRRPQATSDVVGAVSAPGSRRQLIEQALRDLRHCRLLLAPDAAAKTATPARARKVG